MTAPDVGAETDSPSDDTSEKPTTKKDSPGRALRETVLLLAFAILLALVVKTFFVQSFYIPSESMEPGLVVNDRILVQKPSYWNGEPQRGDVIVFDDPGDWLNGLENPEPASVLTKGLAKIGLYPTGGHLVKRVVGVEGDVIVCCDEEGRLSINGVAVDEPYVAEGGKCNGPMPEGRFKCDWTAGPVPKDSLFVMGDNRGNSADSSQHCNFRPKATECDPSNAYVGTDLVVGKVFALAWPPGRAEFIGRADAFEDVPDPS